MSKFEGDASSEFEAKFILCEDQNLITTAPPDIVAKTADAHKETKCWL